MVNKLIFKLSDYLKKNYILDQRDFFKCILVKFALSSNHVKAKEIYDTDYFMTVRNKSVQQKLGKKNNCVRGNLGFQTVVVFSIVARCN